MQVTDAFLYVILFLWASIIFIGGWVERYDLSHDHREIPIYYANGHKKVVYTVCGDTAKVHASGLHGELSNELKAVMFSENIGLSEVAE